MSARVALAVVLMIGAALRFWNISAGLPYRVGPDEPVIAERAIHMMRTGEFHPGFYDYPGLYIYVQLAVGCARFVSGAMAGLWRSVGDFHPEHLFLWTRIVNAALGTLTIGLVYRLGERWGTPAALSAAAILAVWPNHVRESHFALTDVLLTFLVVATALLSLRAVETSRLAWLAAAGAGAGLAAATKYSGAYALVMPLIAAWVTRGQTSRGAASAATIAASGAAFLLAAPYTVRDLPGFLNAFGILSAYYRPRPFGEGAVLYAGHIRAAIGLPGLILLGAGAAWGTLRAFREHELRRWAIVIVFPLVYFFSVSTKYLVFGRYLLPMVPFLCLIMSLALVDGVRAAWRLERPLAARVAIVAVALSFVLFQVVRAGVQWPAEYGRTTTQDVAYAQIRQAIPTGAGVVVERSVLRLPDSLYRKIDVHRMIVRTPEDYIAKGTTFVVASSDAFAPIVDRPSQFPAEYEAYQRVFNRPGHCLRTIQPTPSVSGPQIVICRLDAPIDSSGGR